MWPLRQPWRGGPGGVTCRGSTERVEYKKESGTLYCCVLSDMHYSGFTISPENRGLCEGPRTVQPRYVSTVQVQDKVQYSQGICPLSGALFLVTLQTTQQRKEGDTRPASRELLSSLQHKISTIGDFILWKSYISVNLTFRSSIWGRLGVARAAASSLQIKS